MVMRLCGWSCGCTLLPLVFAHVAVLHSFIDCPPHPLPPLQVSSDYVGGLSLLPGGNYVAAAAADGTLSLLEWRRAGERIASASCGSPLRCCSCDGQLMLAGTESGQLLMWNLAQMTGEASSAGFSLAGPDGLYPALSCPSKAPVNCVAVAVGGVGSGGGGGRKQQQADVAAALDDGSLVLFRNY